MKVSRQGVSHTSNHIIAVTNISTMKVLGNNCYKLKPIEITATKVLKTLLLHAILSWIKMPPFMNKGYVTHIVSIVGPCCNCSKSTKGLKQQYILDWLSNLVEYIQISLVK